MYGNADNTNNSNSLTITDVIYMILLFLSSIYGIACVQTLDRFKDDRYNYMTFRVLASVLSSLACYDFIKISISKLLTLTKNDGIINEELLDLLYVLILGTMEVVSLCAYSRSLTTLMVSFAVKLDEGIEATLASAYSCAISIIIHLFRFCLVAVLECKPELPKILSPWHYLYSDRRPNFCRDIMNCVLIFFLIGSHVVLSWNNWKIFCIYSKSYPKSCTFFWHLTWIIGLVFVYGLLVVVWNLLAIFCSNSKGRVHDSESQPAHPAPRTPGHYSGGASSISTIDVETEQPNRQVAGTSQELPEQQTHRRPLTIRAATPSNS